VRRQGGIPHASTEKAQAPAVSRRDAVLVASALTPPLAWAAALMLNYSLVYPSLSRGNKGLLWAVTGVAEALVILAALFGAYTLRTGLHVGAEARPRTQTLAVTICSLSLVFALAIAAQAVPILLLGLREP